MPGPSPGRPTARFRLGSRCRRTACSAASPTDRWILQRQFQSERRWSTDVSRPRPVDLRDRHHDGRHAAKRDASGAVQREHHGGWRLGRLHVHGVPWKQRNLCQVRDVRVCRPACRWIRTVSISGTVNPDAGAGISITVTATDTNHVSYSKLMSIDVIGDASSASEHSHRTEASSTTARSVQTCGSACLDGGGGGRAVCLVCELACRRACRSGSGSGVTSTVPDARVTASSGGLPTAFGTYNVQVTVTDAQGLAHHEYLSAAHLADAVDATSSRAERSTCRIRASCG